jgi:hypothetical protein
MPRRGDRRDPVQTFLAVAPVTADNTRMDEKRKPEQKLVSSILLSLVAIAFFAAAYRFGTHGITQDDNFCIGLSAVACAIGAVMLWFAFRKKKG